MKIIILLVCISSVTCVDVCNAMEQMHQNAGCCGGEGLSYCSSQKIDMTTLTTDLASVKTDLASVKTAVSAVEVPPSLSPAFLVQSSPAYANSTRNLLFGCSSTGDTAVGTTLCQQYLNALLGAGTIDCTVQQSAEVVNNMANKAYEVFVDPSPTDTMVAIGAAGGFDASPYEIVAVRKRKGTLGYHGAAYFDKARFSGVTSELAPGLEGEALDTANSNTFKKLYDSAMSSRGKFVIGLGRLSSGSSSHSSFSVLKAAGIINETFTIQPAFAGTTIYHHNGDHDINLWDLVHGRVDVAFTWEVEGMIVNADGSFGPLTPALFDGYDDDGLQLASGNMEEVIDPADFVARFGVAAHTVGPIPNAPIIVLKDGIFATEAARSALVDTVSYAVNQDAAFARAGFDDPPLINAFIRKTSDFYESWYATSQVVNGMDFANVKQIVTLLILEDGADKVLRVPMGDKVARTAIEARDADAPNDIFKIKNVFYTTSAKIDKIAVDDWRAANANNLIALGLSNLQAAVGAKGLVAAEFQRDPQSKWVQYLVTSQ